MRRVEEVGRGGGRRRILGEMRIVKMSRAEKGWGKKTGKVEGMRKRIE